MLRVGGVDDALALAAAVLCLAAEVTGNIDLRPHADLTTRTADFRIRAAQERVTRELAMAPRGESGTVHRQLELVATQLDVARVSLRAASTRIRTESMSEVSASLQRLRRCRTMSELTSATPAELNQLGFNRTLFSKLNGTTWITLSAYVQGDAELANSMVRAGTAARRQLTGELVESEMIKDRIPILIEDAPHHAGIHRELLAVTRSNAYIAAPVVSRGVVVGLLHADENCRTGSVDEFDRDIIGLFSEGLGALIDQIICFDQLQTLKGAFADQSARAGLLIDEMLSPSFPLPVSTNHGGPDPQLDRSTTRSGSVAVQQLTRRELEVLRLIAAGLNNSDIAGKLFVAEGTVKSHVKHVLRKLDAANRAEAVTRFHQMSSSDCGY